MNLEGVGGSVLLWFVFDILLFFDCLEELIIKFTVWFVEII